MLTYSVSIMYAYDLLKQNCDVAEWRSATEQL